MAFSRHSFLAGALIAIATALIQPAAAACVSKSCLVPAAFAHEDFSGAVDRVAEPAK